MRLPEAIQPEPETDTIPAIVSRLRINRENLQTYDLQVRQMLDNYAKEQPIFASARAALQEAKELIPKLEDKLKELVRAARTSADMGAMGRVIFTNPQRKVISVDKLRREIPNIAQICPDAIVVTETVDVKVVETAIAAGVIPEHITSLIVKENTTSAGKVEIKYS